MKWTDELEEKVIKVIYWLDSHAIWLSFVLLLIFLAGVFANA